MFLKLILCFYLVNGVSKKNLVGGFHHIFTHIGCATYAVLQDVGHKTDRTRGTLNSFF
jgi:hypothetical protein